MAHSERPQNRAVVARAISQGAAPTGRSPEESEATTLIKDDSQTSIERSANPASCKKVATKMAGTWPITRRATMVASGWLRVSTATNSATAVADSAQAKVMATHSTGLWGTSKTPSLRQPIHAAIAASSHHSAKSTRVSPPVRTMSTAT